MGRKLLVYDRSRVTTDWDCERRRYWNYEYGGRGIVAEGLALELYLGQTIHDGLAGIARGVPISPISEVAHKGVYDALMSNAKGEIESDVHTFAMEQATLIKGLLLGFHKHVWPRLRDSYPEVVAIEQEMTYAHNGLVFMARPDLVLADAEGNLWYIEYKSTSSKKDGWINSWGTAVQLHSSIAAIRTTLGRPVAGVIVQGLYKGYESYGKQSSPFCYAYRREAAPPFVKEETAYEYRQGFRRYPTWELPGGVSAWVDSMPPQILADQFPQTPPIFIKEDLVERFFEQRSVREHEIDLANQLLAMQDLEHPKAVMDTGFPQNFSACYPSFGKPCGYRNLCHGGIETPLENGYAWREPHHDLEASLFAGAKSDA